MPSIGIRMSGGVLSRAAQLQAHAQIEMEPFYPALDLDTLEAALVHARGADWLACVEPAALLGDDSDTVACVVGALIGARGLTVPSGLRPELRLGHSWPGWERGWPGAEHLPPLVPPMT